MEQLKLPFELTDLVPREAEFVLSSKPNQIFKLRRWSLLIRSWAMERFGSERLELIFKHQQINEIAEIAYRMLKDEGNTFLNQDDFLDAVVSVQDQINLVKALLTSVGIGEPELAAIDKALGKREEKPAPKKKSTKPKTGFRPSTP